MKNLVMGFATNQSAQDLKIFITSLRRVYSPDQCDVVLLVDRAPEGVDTSGPLAINLVTTTNVYPIRNKIERRAKSLLIRLASAASQATASAIAGPAKAALRPAMERWHHPCFARWLAYRRFLLAHPEYDNVLLTDVRDVLFQRPFFEERTQGVQFFEQDAVYGVDRCDTDWYREAFGEEGLARVVGRPALCAGTVMGSRDDLVTFIDEFVDWFSVAPFDGVDQAKLNGLLLQGQPRFAYQVNSNGKGPISTLGNQKAAAAIKVVDGQIVNARGAVAPIVHMYDRFAHTMAVGQAFC
jgi:hypothetical protein